MNRDPFLRAALILMLTGAAAVLYAFFGPWRALILAAVGVMVAVFVSVDYSTPAPTREVLRARVRPSSDSDGKPRDFDRLRG